MKYVLIISFNFIFGVIASARTFYIKPNGNNTANGNSIANAWQSIAQINVTTFTAGDTILFEGGSTFNGSMYFSPASNGTSKLPIVVSSYGNGKATIYAANSYGLFAYNNQGYKIDNINFEGSGYTLNNDVGLFFYMDLPNNQSLSNITIANVEVKGFRKAGIEISAYPSDGSRSGYHNVNILNSIAYNNGSVGITIIGNFKTSDTLFNHKNIQILNCIAHHNDGILGSNSHTGNGILVGQTDSCVIAFCEAYENGKNNNFAGGGPAGIWTWDSKFVKIEYCYAHHNRTQTGDGDGFDLDGGVQNSIIQYNYAHDNDGPGLLIAQFTGARKMKNNIVRYNISENDGRGLGALIWSGDPAGTITAEKIDFYNNTIIIDTIGNPFANAALAVYNNYGSMKDIRVCNNIIMAKNNANLLDLNPCLNLKFYNNAYFDFGNGFKFKDNGVTYNSLNNWRSATNQEIYGGKNVGFRINPGLLNAGNAGSILNVDSLKTIKAYRFVGRSNLIGKAIFIDSLLGINKVVKDFYGDSINFNQQYSLGVHEILMPKPLFNVQNNCVNQGVFFENKSEFSNSYLWKFGDGNTSTLASPNHTYLIAGNYTITLIASGKYGYKDSTKKSITIYQKPIANFITSNVCLKDTTIFKNLSINSNLYKWYFENNNSSILQNPKILYANAGNYKVTLIANQAQLCSDTIRKIVSVFQPSNANFYADNACLGNSTSFTFDSINTTQYFWNMGNGDSLNYANSFKYYYANEGNYMVKLKVISKGGCKDSISKIVKIYPKPKAMFLAQNTCLHDTAFLNNLSTDSCSYLWSISSNDSFAIKNPKIVFSKPGNYTVILKVKNTYNCSDTIEKQIEVLPLPNPNFTYIQIGNKFYFQSNDSLALSYKWQILDTLIQTSKFSIIPKVNSNFTVKLTVINFNGCDSTFQMLVPNETSSLMPNQYSEIQLKIFPNPFTDNVNLLFQLNKDSKVSLNIINAIGVKKSIFNQEIKNIGLHQITIDKNDFLDNGLYIFQLTINEKMYFYKVIKQ